MNLKKKAIKGVVWSAVQSWGSQGVALVVFFCLARLLTPVEFGLVALANVFLAFMQIFLGEGFAKAIIQRKNIEPAHLDTVFWLNFGVSIALFFITLATASWLGNIFDEPDLAPVLRGFSILFIITSFSTVQQAILEREFDFKSIAMRSLLGISLSGAVGITMAIAGLGVWSLVGQQIVHELVAVITLWRLSDWRPGFKVSMRHFQDLWSFAAATLGFKALTFAHTRADDLLIGYFLDSAALGLYSLAYKVFTILSMLLIKTSNRVALPIFSRLQDDIEQLRQSFHWMTKLTSLVSFPVFISVVLLAHELISVIFGPQWLAAVPVLQLLALVGLMRAATFFKSSVFMALNKPHWRLYLGLLDTCLNLIGFIIAVRWGIVAVAFAYLVRFYLMFPLGQWLVGILIQTSMLEYLQQFLTPFLSTLAMVAAILGIKFSVGAELSPIWVFISCTGCGAIVYVAALFFLDPKLFHKVNELGRLALERS